MSTKKPLVSICILNRNWENRLPKAIPSILCQDYDNLEILFLDNNSTDKSLAYISQFEKIKTINSDINLWVSGGRNKLSKMSKGEYIFFLDNDIELTRNDFIEQLLSDYEKLKGKNVWAIFPVSRMENDDIYCNLWLLFHKLQKIKFKDIYQTWFIPRWWFEWSAFFMEKKIFEDLWCFDEKYPFSMNDNDLSMRMNNMWYTIFADTNLYTIHHWNDARTNINSIWWKYQYLFCGFMRSILKNYNIKNLLKRWLISGWWIFTKACKLSIKYRSFLPIKSFIKSVFTFFRDLPDTLKQRKYYQSIRVTKDDLFLNIK